MMFVGHRMDEIYRIADRIAVLRDGRLIGVEAEGRAWPRDRAISMMVGRELLGALSRTTATPPATLVLEARGLSRAGDFAGHRPHASHAGEILGLGGLVGSGRTEIARVLFGIDQPDAGEHPASTARACASHRRATPWRPASPMSRRTGIGQSLVMDFSDPRQCRAAGARQGRPRPASTSHRNARSTWSRTGLER